MLAPAHLIPPLAPEFCGKRRTKPALPLALGFVADLDPAFVQQVFDIAQRQREPEIKHHCQADDLWTCLEVAKGGALCHIRRLAIYPAPRQPKFL